MVAYIHRQENGNVMTLKHVLKLCNTVSLIFSCLPCTIYKVFFFLPIILLFPSTSCEFVICEAR